MNGEKLVLWRGQLKLEIRSKEWISAASGLLDVFT
jgi:hypothetical protein